MTEVNAAVIKVVRSRLLIGEPRTDFFAAFRHWEEQSTPISAIVHAFRSNLQSAINVGSVPFQLIYEGAHLRRFGHMISAERIRQLNHSRLTEEERSRRALEIARLRYAEMQGEADYQAEITAEVVDSLFRTLQSSEFNFAMEELLRQVSVMIWGALEVVATDVAIQILNERPSLANEVVATDAFKRMGISKGISVEMLESFLFNVSRSMGTILFGDRRLDSLQAMAAVSSSLYKSPLLDIQLKSINLWTLAQRRHLIVHRRGVVDAQYRAKTADTLAEGQRIQILSSDVDTYLTEVRDTGLLITRLASELPVE